MVWIVVYWSRDMESSPPSMELFNTKECAVKYIVNEIKDYTGGEFWGSLYLLKEAFMMGEKDQFDLGKYAYWALKNQTPK